MGTRLFVGNLSYSVTDTLLQEAFGRFGNVVSASVVVDKMSGRSRGFGFVELSSEAEAERAVSEMNGAELDGRYRASLRFGEILDRSGGCRESTSRRRHGRFRARDHDDRYEAENSLDEAPDGR